MDKYTVGFDLGGTKMLCLVLDAGGRIRARVKSRTMLEGKASLLVKAVADTVAAALSEAGCDASAVGGVGVSVPGPVDEASGTVLQTPNIGIKNFALRDALGKELGLPVIVENDVNAGTYAEFKHGAGRGFAHLIGVFPGTGIGGGLILDSRLYRGARGGAGEIGHMIIQIGGRACGCGNYGCLEAHASRTALAKDLVSLSATGRAPVLAEECGSDFSLLKSGAIARAVAAGDKDVQRLVRRSAWFLGVGLANCVNLFNPQAIVIGGGLVEKLKGFYLKEAEKSMREHAMAHLVERVRVVEAELGDDAVAMGAALLAGEIAWGKS